MNRCSHHTRGENIFLFVFLLIRIRTKWNDQSPSPKQTPAKQTLLRSWRVEYNKAVKQPLFRVCSVCSNKVWLCCSVWDESALFEVMHMQCDSPCLWAVFLCPANAVYSSRALWKSSAWGVLCTAVQLALIFIMSDTRGGWRESTQGHFALVGLEKIEAVESRYLLI